MFPVIMASIKRRPYNFVMKKTTPHITVHGVTEDMPNNVLRVFRFPYTFNG
jgi:hypothetical protein